MTVNGQPFEVLVQQSRAAWANGDADASLSALRQALLARPDRADVWYTYGRRAIEAGRSELAVAAVQNVLDLRPWHVDALETLTELVRQRDLQAEIIKDALCGLEGALAAHPEIHRDALDLLVPTRRLSAIAFLAESDDPVASEVARAYLAHKGKPEDVAAHEELRVSPEAELRFCLAVGKVGRAADVAATMSAEELPAAALRRAARRHLARDQQKRAARVLDIYLRAQPDDDWATRRRAELRELASLGQSLGGSAAPTNYQLLRSGFPFSDARTTPAYEPSERHALYLLHNSLPYASAGYATRSHGLLRGLREHWDVTGVTRLGFPFDAPGHDALERIEPSDTIDGVPYLRLSTETGRWQKDPVTGYVARYAAAVREVAESTRPFVIHAASNHWNGLTAVEAGRQLGIPSVYEVRGLWEVTRASRNPGWRDSGMYRYIRRMEADAAAAADRVITITDGLRDEMIARGVAEEKITVVPNGVDTTRFVPRERDRELEAALGVQGRTVIGYVGSLLDYEGIDLLLEAAAALAAERDDFHVLIVGDGAERTRFETYAEELGLLGRSVTFTGRVPHADVERYYSLVDVAPFPRLPLEVCELVSPLKPFEAMAMGKAVVASDVRALAEIFPDESVGVLHRKGDAGSLTRVLRSLLDDRNRVRAMGEEARRWVVANRDWQSLASRVSDIYDDLRQGSR